MKLKRLAGATTVIASALFMSSAVHAAVYSIDSATTTAGSNVTLKVYASPNNSASSSQLNAYKLGITYDGTVLSPTIVGTDVTNADLYAENSLGSGIIVSEPVASGSTSKLAIGWANSTAKTISADTPIAEIKFQVAPTAEPGDVELGIVDMATAISDTSFDSADSAVNGVITIKSSSQQGGGESGGDSEIGGAVETDGELIPEGKLGDEYVASIMDSATASFEGRIGLNFYLQLPEYITNDENAFVLFKKGDKTYKFLVKNAEKSTTGGTTLYKFSYYTVAKEIRENINLRLCTGNNELAPLKGKSGSVYTESGVNYSLITYVNKKKSSTTDTNMYNLVEAVEDYGTAAQIYFTGATDVSVSSRATSVTASDLDGYKGQFEGSYPAGITGRSLSALFESDNTLRVYFKYDGSIAPENYTYSIDGEETSIQQTEAGDYYLAVKNIAAKELDKTHSFTVSDGTTSYTVKASALTYARSCVVNGEEARQNLGKSLYNYNKAAKAYFGA